MSEHTFKALFVLEMFVKFKAQALWYFRYPWIDMASFIVLMPSVLCVILLNVIQLGFKLAFSGSKWDAVWYVSAHTFEALCVLLNAIQLGFKIAC